jgi:hypothetical protein
MALSKSVTLKNNFGEFTTFPNAYIRVERVTNTKELCRANVTTYKELAGIPVSADTYEFALDLDGGNSIKQAYEYLKTLDQFADATDC